MPPIRHNRSAQKRTATAKQTRLRREEELTRLDEDETEAEGALMSEKRLNRIRAKVATNEREKSSALKSKKGGERVRARAEKTNHTNQKKAKYAERARQKRAQETEEEREERRAKDAAKKREKRQVLKSEEDLKLLRVRAIDAERARRKRAQMTEEERRERNAKNAARKREKRLALHSEGKIKELRARENEQKRQRRAQMTDEERQKASAKALEKGRQKYAEMTEEERKERTARKVEYNRQKMARMTEEEKIKYRAEKKDRIRRLKEGRTTDERIRGLLSQAGEFVYRNPARYEAAGAFIKSSLGDILSMHKEIEKLRKNIRQAVADALKNALNSHRIEKQTRKEGCQSLTFVEMSPRPLNTAKLIKKEVNTDANETDPLLCQSDVSIQSSTNQIQSKRNDQTNESFEVCSYDTSAASESISGEIILPKKSFECFICSKKFASTLGLTIHQGQHRTVSEMFKCSICFQMFFTYNLMTNHYLQIHSIEFSPFDNEVEDEDSDEELERHRHKFDFLFLRQCSICPDKFDRSRVGLTTYSHHVVRHHSENRDLLKNFAYTCSMCQKPYAVLNSLESHWQSICFEKWKNTDLSTRGIVCENCGVQFKNEKSLASHLKMFHAESKTQICETCGKNFKNKITLKMHMNFHNAEAKYFCEHCGKRWKLKHNLIKHVNLVHLKVKPFPCTLCPLRFSSNLKLEYHMNTHTGEKPYKCNICDARFSAKASLTLHEKRHDGKTYSYKPKAKSDANKTSSRKRSAPGEGSHICNICGKGYKTTFVLRDHKYTHDNLERFGCSLCSRKFRQKANFYQHKVKHHPNDTPQLVRLISDDEASLPSIACSATQQKKSSASTSNVFSAPVPNVFSAPTPNIFSTPMPNVFSTPTPNVFPAPPPNAFPVPPPNTFPIPPPNTFPIPPPNPFSTTPSIYYNNSSAGHYNNPLVPPYYPGIDLSKNYHGMYNTAVSNYSKPNFYETNPQNSSSYMDLLRPHEPSELSNVSSLSVEPQDSPALEDYSTGMDSDNEGNVNENALLEIGKLGSDNTQSHISPDTTNVSNHSKNVVGEINSEMPCSLPIPKFVDFSRANVPLVSSNSTDDVNDSKVEDSNIITQERTAVEGVQQPKVGIEDSEDTLENDVDINSLLKIKIEALGEEEIENVSNDAISDSAPRLVVKLRRLLQHNCIPCGKTIFAASLRTIRQHKRTHLENREAISQSKHKRVKSDKRDGKPKLIRKRYFDCMYCDKKKLYSRKMIAHCAKEHPGKEALKCPFCPKLLRTVNAYFNHKSGHTNPLIRDPNAKKECLCEVCGKAFQYKQDVYVHRWNMHRRPKEGEPIKFPCDMCPRSFRTKSNMNLHRDRVHLKVRPYLCEECGMAFFLPLELKRHVMSAHRYTPMPRSSSDVHKFFCTICPYRFLTENGLKQHQALHDPRRKYGCDDCGLRFKHYDTLWGHRRNKHKRNGKRNLVPKLPPPQLSP